MIVSHDLYQTMMINYLFTIYWSLTKRVTTMVAIGRAAHMNEMFRQGRYEPNKYSMHIPIVATMPAKIIKIPRTDGSLFNVFNYFVLIRLKELKNILNGFD